jgi:hypothetical protein
MDGHSGVCGDESKSKGQKTKCGSFFPFDRLRGRMTTIWIVAGVDYS